MTPREGKGVSAEVQHDRAKNWMSGVVLEGTGFKANNHSGSLLDRHLRFES